MYRSAVIGWAEFGAAPCWVMGAAETLMVLMVGSGSWPGSGVTVSGRAGSGGASKLTAQRFEACSDRDVGSGDDKALAPPGGTGNHAHLARGYTEHLGDRRDDGAVGRTSDGAGTDHDK
jgi:hypothetical protein